MVLEALGRRQTVAYLAQQAARVVEGKASAQVMVLRWLDVNGEPQGAVMTLTARE